MTNEEAIEILNDFNNVEGSAVIRMTSLREAIDLAVKALEEVKGLRLLIDWAVECDFGYDNIPEEYEKYKEEISDMRYTEGLIYIAKKEAENE